MQAAEYVAELVEKARKAQAVFETWSQEQVDEAVRVIGKAVFDQAEPLAQLAVDETGMGVFEDKVAKTKGKPRITWHQIKGKKSRGILRYIEEKGLVEIAKPMGVVGAITPTTNPTSTLIHNAMVTLKGGNSMIICPHPSAKKCGKATVDAMNDALKKIGAPENLIQIVEEPTMEISNLIMSKTDVCISTGGPGVVKAAYSSGKPAYGVGAGNVQVLIDRDVDIPAAVDMVIIGRTYDNGILCTCEQSAIMPAEKYDEIVAEFVKQGVFYIDDEKQMAALRQVMFPDGGPISKAVVGASPFKIAEMAGIQVPENTKSLMVKAAGSGMADDFSREKLCPVLAAYSYNTWEEAVKIAADNLEREGKGHSMVIHSNTKENVEYAALNICVSRFAVNQAGSPNIGGSFFNGLNTTSTLGCGSWGNNIISENLHYGHLINTVRIAYKLEDPQIPSDEEVWGA